MLEPEKQEEIVSHPLWSEYSDLKRQMIEIRPTAEAGDPLFGQALEAIESRLSEITKKIGKDLDLVTLNSSPEDQNT